MDNEPDEFFIHMYFHVTNPDTNVTTKLDNLTNDEMTLILNYIQEIGLKNVVAECNNDTFKFVKPQFRFVCERDYDLDIVKYNFGGYYLKKGTVVYATNLFAKETDNILQEIVSKFYKDKTYFAANNLAGDIKVDKKFFVWNGSDGIIFARPYVDWLGLKVCNGKPYYLNDLYRLYIIGEEVVKSFIENNYNVPEGAVLKNFYKGTPLTRYPTNENHIITYKFFSTNNADVVFEQFKKEFDHDVNTITFVQRDYIYDAAYPESLLLLLQKNYTSETSIVKRVSRFKNVGVPNLGNLMMIDRFGINKYRKIIVNNQYGVPKSVAGTNGNKLQEYIFVPSEFLQIRHTLNAAYVPYLGLVILANHVFFGASTVLNFNPANDLFTFVKVKIKLKEDDIYYHIGGEFYLEQTQFSANAVPVFIIVRINNQLNQTNLIRTSRKLKDLKYNWVHNTILNLFANPIIKEDRL